MNDLDDLRRRAGLNEADIAPKYMFRGRGSSTNAQQHADPDLIKFIDLIHRMVRRAQASDIDNPEVVNLIDRIDATMQKFAAQRGIELSFKWYGR